VKARVLKIRRDLPQWEVLSAVARTIERGGIVAFPTDTTYGFAASIWCESAIARLRQMKHRDAGKGFVVIASDVDSVEELAVRISRAHRRLMETYWPGPLTIVFEASPVVPRYLLRGARTIAIRVPADTLTQSILRVCGKPLAAPSANAKGGPPAVSAREVLRDFAAGVDLVLDGGRVEPALPSTIVAVRRRGLEILRRGQVLVGEASR
jgi:L-threonylcarbamoyladenylate synthase